MAPIPTMSRIFADQYLRELRRREALHANHISPGSKNWTDAMLDMFEHLHTLGSPIKRASFLSKLGGYLNDSVTDDGFAHFVLSFGGAKRSSALIVATLGVGEHPLKGVNETGVNILHHYVITQRNGCMSALADVNLAYVSKHALARMHERGLNTTSADATTGVLASIGALGLIIRNSDKHTDCGMCLRVNDALVVGSVRYALKNLSETKSIATTVFDVRTALPVDEVRDRRMVAQGELATKVVDNWLSHRTMKPENLAKLSEAIPSLPQRENDYPILAGRAAALAKEQPA